MQIRKQQRHRKYMRTKETAFTKQKEDQGRMPSAPYWGSNVTYKLEQTVKT